MSSGNICLIGDIIVDVTLKTPNSKIKLRMGGILHVARCLWALKIPFSVRYFAPAYLDTQIHKYLNSLGCSDIKKLGDVTGTPYVFLIEEVKEVGDQGYEFLLRDEVTIHYFEEAFTTLRDEQFNHLLLISGNYDLVKVISNAKGLLHIDIANNVKTFEILNQITRPIETLFISTSSNLFKDYYQNDFYHYCNLFKKYTKQIILKENRGGSRYFRFSDNSLVIGFAQTRIIQHSVGVGDVYDAVFVSFYTTKCIEETLSLASWISAEYASTTYPDDFKTGVERVLKVPLKELVDMKGISLPWERRKEISIYVAAPDFDHVDIRPIEKLAESLTYHNFSPRRPVKENGQMEIDAPKSRKQELFHKDMHLLKECSILVAVLLYNDPGTLIEIGIASTIGIPTLVYDPYNLANNCMLTELPQVVSNDLDVIISEIFIMSSRKMGI